MSIDLEADALLPTDGALKRVSELAELQLELEAEVAAIEAKLDDATKRLNAVQMKELPDALKAAGIDEFKLTNGTKVIIKDDMSISVSKDKMPGVCKWLRQNKHDDIIKAQITVELPKGTDPKLVSKVEKFLSGTPLAFNKGETVNSQTLKALLKEQREKGKTINLSDFGAYEYTKSIIKLPK
jgi:hypothetical protein